MGYDPKSNRQFFNLRATHWSRSVPKEVQLYFVRRNKSESRGRKPVAELIGFTFVKSK